MGNLVVRYGSKNNEGVLDRPQTKWMVLSAIGITLKFQFTDDHETQRLDCSVRRKIEDLGPTELRTVFPYTSVLPKPPQLQYGDKKQVFMKTHFPRFTNKCLECNTRHKITSTTVWFA
jgi:hypothetical protein